MLVYFELSITPMGIYWIQFFLVIPWQHGRALNMVWNLLREALFGVLAMGLSSGHGGTPGSHMVMILSPSRPKEFVDSTMSQIFLNTDGSWNMSRLEEHFWHMDVREILEQNITGTSTRLFGLVPR